mgnify:CR=1 FL=1|jgi:hypothetical protein
MNKIIKKFLLHIIDFNDNKKIDKFEIIIAILVVLLIELFAEFVANIVFSLF